MCGIFGFSWPDEDFLKENIELISHRGPDDTGTYVDQYVSLGHKRLSIIDLSDAGFQPMFYHPTHGASSSKFQPEFYTESSLALVFNGEIYNFKEIRKELSGEGYIFKTSCDSELILAAYHKWGAACTTKFNGMWALCIYDKEKQALFLSRDRMGIKPLYYWQDNGKIAFGSELKLLMTFSGIKKDISAYALNHYLLFGYCPSAHSMLGAVRKLQAGHNLLFDLNKGQIVYDEAYWQVSFAQQAYAESDVMSRLTAQLTQAVKRRMLSDVPIGAFLSGGVDSSVVV